METIPFYQTWRVKDLEDTFQNTTVEKEVELYINMEKSTVTFKYNTFLEVHSFAKILEYSSAIEDNYKIFKSAKLYWKAYVKWADLFKILRVRLGI